MNAKPCPYKEFDVDEALYFYDIIIDVNSLSKIKKVENSDDYGWNVYYSEEGRDEHEIMKLDRLDYSTAVGITGGNNSGKTFVISRIIGDETPIGKKYVAKGVGIKISKINNKKIFFLEESTMESPLLVAEELKKSKEETTYEKKYAELTGDRELTKYFLTSFILMISNVFIVTLSGCTSYEQKLLIQVKNLDISYAVIIVVHNLYHLTSIKEVKQYIDNFIKNSATFRVKECQMSEKPKDENKNNIYFSEDIKATESRLKNGKVYHFIVAAEGTEAGNYYNQTAFSFIRSFLGAKKQLRQPIITERLMQYYHLYSFVYMEEPVKPGDVLYDEKKSKIYVNSDKKITLRKIYFDELGVGKIAEGIIRPNYEYWYENEKKTFKLKVELPGKIKLTTLRMGRIGQENFINIEGVKSLPSIINLENIDKSTFFSNVQEGCFLFCLKFPILTFGEFFWDDDNKDWDEEIGKEQEIKDGTIILSFSTEFNNKKYLEINRVLEKYKKEKTII